MATRIVQAVAITATICMIIFGILFYFAYKFAVSRRLKRTRLDSSFHREVETPLPRIEFRQHCGAIKGLIVDEEGLDMLYVRRLEGGHQFSPCFSKNGYNPIDEDKMKRMNSSSGGQKPMQETPLLQEPIRINGYEVEVKKPLSVKQNISPPPPPPPPPPSFVSEKGKLKPAPPPSPPKLKPVPPLLPAKRSGLTASSKPPIPPRDSESRQSKPEDPAEETTKENGLQMKLRPLHWDKVTANADHSMIWNEIKDGSFRFDDNLMESLFGYTTANPKPTTLKSKESSRHANSNTLPPAQIFLLDPRKSQNTSIVLKSLPISHKEVIDSLSEGRGLNCDTLEKLTKIRPTQDEITKVLDFKGNPTKLAHAESFLYHVLKAVPWAFIRLNAMLFRSTYDPEISHLKKSLQTLELGCKELRTGRVFFKLLEAILKAGNRLNAGTNRGDAKGFDLAALRRLSDVKSTDGKTTLLYFVVEQVVRAEGERCLDNRNSNSERKDDEPTVPGLKVLESLDSDFANVKKAASVDYEGLSGAWSILAKRVDETKRVLNVCGESESKSESGGFSRVMKGFLEDCEGELSTVREEERRVMEIVRKTTAFYQAKEKFGEININNSLQLFVIVRDFLNNVDRVCAEIGKKLKKGKVGSGGAGSSPPLKSPVRFQNLEVYFRAERGGTSSSSEDDF